MHVHSKKAKCSHIHDFGCSQNGNSHFNFVNQNSSVKSRDSGSDQFGHSHFKGVTNGYALWSLSLNASVLASVHTYIAKRPSSPIYRITGPRMGEQVQVG